MSARRRNVERKRRIAKRAALKMASLIFVAYTGKQIRMALRLGFKRSQIRRLVIGTTIMPPFSPIKINTE